ncbi:MAG TPA: LysM peptidoglycan-binding domain-containing protein [Chloroflexia bacterium]|nr:LysM peptidoglycan-binding domain-containing protein [Chloroflexia bacterium]
MPDQKPLLLAQKGRPTAAIAMFPVAYQALMTAALAQVPAESFGALIGTPAESRRIKGASKTGEAWKVIEEIEPVTLLPATPGLAPNMEQWAALAKRLAGDKDKAGKSILGWFYTDPAIGIFKPRADIMGIADALGAAGSLLLVVNPIADQGAFYVRQDGLFVPTGGFHEVLAKQGAPHAIPWSGEVQGAQGWLEGSHPTNINLGDAALAGYTPVEGEHQEATLSPDEPVSTVKWDSYPPGSPGALRRTGPATAPLPPLTNDPMQPVEPVQAAPTASFAHGWVQVTEPVGRTNRTSRRAWLPVLGAVLSIAVLVALVGSTLLQTGTNQPPPAIPTPTIQTQIAPRPTVALPAAVATAYLTPTLPPTRLPIATLTATATVPPATDTPTPTTVPATAPPTVTPTPTITTYVVQEGDTLTSIAQRFGTTIDAIIAANNLPSTVITIGQMLVIP